MPDELVDRLCKASAKGNLSEVLLLLQDGADVNGLNKYNRTALQVVMLGHSALVEALLVAGADPDIPDPACGLTVTHDAARDGFIYSVRVLVEHGANVNLVDVKGNLALHLAAKEGHLEVVRLLTEHTDDPQAPNGAGDTARQLALQHGKMDVVQYIDEYLSSH
ncbi:cyclin-dependent kinase 4 inhibitor C [Pagrus major]|uniref:cyclin-dependent kinase 4 inhibitor C n=1 Tax=Pagrus major TaxID=143350 RepID=UPI003CC870BB